MPLCRNQMRHNGMQIYSSESAVEYFSMNVLFELKI